MKLILQRTTLIIFSVFCALGSQSYASDLCPVSTSPSTPAPFGFVPFARYTIPSSTYKTVVKKGDAKLLLTRTPFQSTNIPSQRHLTIIGENSYTATTQDVVVCGPNCPCVAVIAAQENNAAVFALHCHYTTSHQACAQTIAQWAPLCSVKNLKVLLYSVIINPAEYNEPDYIYSWANLHNGRSQVAHITDLAQSLENVGIIAHNITIALIQEKKYPERTKERFHLLNLLIDPLKKGIDNPWGVYNTIIRAQFFSNKTKKIFSARDAYDISHSRTSYGDLSMHFRTIQQVAGYCVTQKSCVLYNTLPPVHVSTENCQNCSDCIAQEIST